MTTLVERDRITDDAGPDDGTWRPTRVPPRRCTVLESTATDAGVALLYVFYRGIPLSGADASRPPHVPGKRWRHAAGWRAGDRLRLGNGEIVVIDKLVAAPSLGDIGAFQADRIRTYRLSPEGRWC
jgi:hypothetical protein